MTSVRRLSNKPIENQKQKVEYVGKRKEINDLINHLKNNPKSNDKLTKIDEL